MMIKRSSMPSLQEIVMVKVTTLLWSEENIAKMQPTSSIVFQDLERLSPKWRPDEEVTQAWNVIKETVNEVKGKVLNLSIPNRIKEEILPIVRPIGFQYLAWVHYHSNCYDMIRKLPTTFHWTSQGTVDRKAMAEMLVQDPTIDVERRFKLACMYCLVPDIRALWEQLPDDHNRSDFGIKRYPWRHDELVTFWARFLRNNASHLSELPRFCTRCSSIYTHGFRASVDAGNSVAAQYFLKYLTQEDIFAFLPVVVRSIPEIPRNFVRVPVIPKNYFGDVLHFVLSLVDEEVQRNNLLDSKSCIMDLLEWPWNRFLKHVPSYPTAPNYFVCIIELSSKVIKGYEDEDLLLLVWEQIPLKLLPVIINFIVENGTYIRLYFKWEKSIKFLLGKMITEQRKELLLKEGSAICSDLIDRESWDLMRYFIRVCSATRSTLEDFKHKCSVFEHTHAEEDWDRIFQICNELMPSFENNAVVIDESMDIE